MTHEQLDAFQTWWSRTNIECQYGTMCRDAFASGWEAHAAASRTGEREVAEQAARQIERAHIERRLLAMACHAFIAGKDEKAHWFRSLVNVLFKKA